VLDLQSLVISLLIRLEKIKKRIISPQNYCLIQNHPNRMVRGHPDL